MITIGGRAGRRGSPAGGNCIDAPTEVTSSGSDGSPLAPGVQHLGGALDGEEQHAGVDLAHRVEPELERGDDAEVAAAAAQRPEQLGLVLASARTRSPSAVTSSIAVTLLAGRPWLARQPADAAAERVADDADVGRGAVERREPVPRTPRRRRPPTRAGADAGAPAPRRRSRRRACAEVLDQDRALERADGGGVVAGGLRRDAQAGGARGLDDRDDVVGVAGKATAAGAGRPRG